jgi:hypothetical protein
VSGYDPRQVFTNPGRLFLNPTTVFPLAGGVQIGYVRAAKLVKRTKWGYSDSPARGRAKVETYRGMTEAQLWFILAQNDPTALNQTWANSQTSANGFSGANVLSLPQVGQNVEPGLVTPSAVLAFVPDDPDKPGGIIYAPSWAEEEEVNLDLTIDKPYEFSAFVVNVGLDALNRDLAWDKLENLDMTGVLPPGPVPSAPAGQGVPLVPLTGSGTVTAENSGLVFTNAGASAEIDVTLDEAAPVGTVFTFIVKANQVLKVLAGAASTLQVGGLLSPVAGYASNGVSGSEIQFCRDTTTSWFALSSRGAWSVGP